MNTNFPKEYVIGIDIGGTNFRIGGITAENKLIAEPQKYSSQQMFGNASPTDVLEKVISRLHTKRYLYWFSRNSRCIQRKRHILSQPDYFYRC